MIVWLTGPSGAGKTTLAKKLINNGLWINLDGDEMRATISTDEGFSREDRRKHNLRIARLAQFLHSQYNSLLGINIVVSVIAPMENVRKEIEKICHPIWIYIKRKLPQREGHFYEVPESPEYIIDNDELSEEMAYHKLVGIVMQERSIENKIE